MKKYFLLIALAGLFLTSCEKCKDCQVKVEFLSTSALTDADCQLVYQMDCEEYFNSVYAVSAVEYCGDDLKAVDGLDLSATTDMRAYYDCQ